jgi:hypothetical protein
MPLTNAEIIPFVKRWRGLPDDYLRYLRTEESGKTFDNGITMLPTPMPANELFPGQIQHEGNFRLVLFAKDLRGRYYGFNTGYSLYRIECVEEGLGLRNGSEDITTFTDVTRILFDEHGDFVVPPHAISQVRYRSAVRLYLIVLGIVILALTGLIINAVLQNR